jgi:hypothetical protein
MDAAVCSPAEPALWWQAMSHRYTSPMKGLCPQSPRDPWVHNPANPALLTYHLRLRSSARTPTSCSLRNGRIGLIAPLLLAVLSHRLADALRSTDRVITPRSWPSLGACALGRSPNTSLHRDPSSARWLHATSWAHSGTFARRDPMNNQFLRATA